MVDRLDAERYGGPGGGAGEDERVQQPGGQPLAQPRGAADAWRRAAAWNTSSVGGFQGATGCSSPPAPASRCTCCAHED
ncbi:hypothetical protein STAFG_1276 [Streptomyces afghaniensis 772]|uniref:Uncharacterized protein n=1 Tax=Streptomyces afghaniensis 772 TaxID=1283301 RepID=S4MXB1_9ACTN|nr:hypothetical protein STAFG_1276 [Streptomyces afghaniensis 772]